MHYFVDISDDTIFLIKFMAGCFTAKISITVKNKAKYKV